MRATAAKLALASAKGPSESACTHAGCHGDPSSCEGYTPVLNCKGENVLIGNVAYEGYLFSRPHPFCCASCANVTCS